MEGQQVSDLDDAVYTFCFNEMPRLHLASLVVAFLTRNARTTTLDLLARVSVLEGIAGVKPGTWMP